MFSFCNSHRYVIYNETINYEKLDILEAPGPGFTYIQISKIKNDTTTYSFYHPCKSYIQKAIKSVKQNGIYEEWYGVTDSVGGFNTFGLPVFPSVNQNNYYFIPLSIDEIRLFEIAMNTISSDSCLIYDLRKLIGFVRK